MKMVCFGDAHLGAQSYGRIDAVTNLNTRVLNALKSLDEVVDYAIKRNVRLIVFAGDAYHKSLPSSTLTSEFNKRISRAANHGIKVLLLSGNHDVDKIETKKSPLIVFNDLDVNNVIETRFHREELVTIDGETIKFVFLPTYHTAEEIEEITNNTTYDGYPIVYIFHGTFKGANLNDWNIAEKETYVDPAIFDKPGVAACISGHLHKHQILYNKPLVFYTGSLQRVDFSEEKQDKGFIVLDVEQDCAVTYDYLKVESQKFFTLDLDLIGESNETDIIIDNLEMFKKKVEKAITRIRIDVDKSNSINEARIYEYAYQLGAENVLDIQKRFQKQNTTRVAGLTEHVDEHKALELYYKGKDNSDNLIKKGKEIIERAKKEGLIS
ncbi:putative metallophosphoesterase YhaO [compost metagenome]